MGIESGYIIVFVTASSAEEAGKLSKALIDHKLAACVNTAPVASVFTWQGKTEKAEEILMIIKTRADLFEKLETLVKKEHSYDVPEIIAIPIFAGSKDYLDWIDESTK
ncbi:MAG: divalent-cation tolerance protein CutA [Candidatus Omnitrophota bacterium]